MTLTLISLLEMHCFSEPCNTIGNCFSTQ